MKTINSMIDLVFILDIILNFRTTYIDLMSGEEILDPFLLAKKYLESMQFYIDVLSSVPLDEMNGGGG